MEEKTKQKTKQLKINSDFNYQGMSERFCEQILFTRGG